jgi:hypothetical protein
MIKTRQKLIKIGTSRGVILPAKALEGIADGAELDITIKPVGAASDPQAALMKDYQEFVAEYGQTLKNLAQR